LENIPAGLLRTDSIKAPVGKDIPCKDADSFSLSGCCLRIDGHGIREGIHPDECSLIDAQLADFIKYLRLK
jgi:hypothetical protein